VTAGTLTTEQEAKFEVDESYDPPDLPPLVRRTRRLPEHRLHTAYYDSADLRLWRRGITLCYRTGEGGAEDAGTWTLKLPASDHEEVLHRDELTWRSARGTIPDEATAVLRGLVRRSVLDEVVWLDTRRRRLAVHGPESGRAWGELDDDLVTVIGGPNDGLRFRQVELELAPAHPPEAQAVLDTLRRSGARPTARAKLDIALGDRRTGQNAGDGSGRRWRTPYEHRCR
jgi:hypothetical protein